MLDEEDHISLEQGLRVKFTAGRFLDRILLIMRQNLWKVKSQKLTIGAFKFQKVNQF